MSWAALARKVKDVPQPSTLEVVPQRVIAASSAEDKTLVKLQNLEKHTAKTFTIPEIRKGCLVLDANAFIKGMDDYLSRADVFITIPQVVQEVKDRHSRALLERLPVELTVLDPTGDSINKVVDIATATGDLGALSRTDIRLCALGLDIGTQLAALKPAIAPGSLRLNPDQVEVVDGDDAEESDASEGEDNDSDDDTTAEAKPSEEAMPGWGGSDDEGEWINEETMDRVKGFSVRKEGEKTMELDDETNEGTDPFESGFATATSDFPMQNVLMHLGVPIVGPNGFLIRELRQWLLRCHACFTIVTDTTRQFCPECGSGNTLKRVSYTVAETGEKKLFVNFKHHISTRGNVYRLPAPRGGRNGTNRTLVLREDQLANCGRQSAAAKRKAAVAAAAAAASTNDDLRGFGERAAGTVRRTANAAKTSSSYVKFNINEKRKARAGRRK